MVRTLFLFYFVFFIASCVTDSMDSKESEALYMQDTQNTSKSFCAFDYPVFSKKIKGCLDFSNVAKESLLLALNCSKVKGRITENCFAGTAELGSCLYKTSTGKSYRARFFGETISDEYLGCMGIHQQGLLDTKSVLFDPHQNVLRPTLDGLPFLVTDIDQTSTAPVIEYGNSPLETLDYHSIRNYLSLHLKFIKDAYPKSPLNGVVAKIEKNELELYTIILKNKADSGWSVMFNNLESTTLHEGDTVMVGEKIGVPSLKKSIAFGIYRDYDFYSLCPHLYFSVSNRQQLTSTLKMLMTLPENLYDESKQIVESSEKLYGCQNRDFIPFN